MNAERSGWDFDKVNSAVWAAQEDIAALEAVYSLSDLSVTFKSLCHNILSIGRHFKKEIQRELCSGGHAVVEKVLGSLIAIQLRLPMLHKVLQHYLCHPLSAQAKAGKSSVMRQMFLQLDGILHTVQNWNSGQLEQIMDKDSVQAEMFVKKVDTILECLASNSQSTELSCHVTQVVSFSLEVAHVARASASQKLMRNCQEVLDAAREISDTDVKIDDEHVCRDAAAASDKLSEKIQILEQNVNTVVLEQLVDIFVQPTTKLQRVYEATQQHASPTHADIDQRLMEFRDHFDTVCQVCGFAIAFASDLNRVRRIKALLRILEDVDLEFSVVSTTVCSQSATAGGALYQTGVSASLEYFRLVSSMWVKYTVMLRNIIDEITEPVSFLHITVFKMKRDLAEIRRILDGNGAADAEELRNTYDSFSSHVTRALQMADTTYRNELLGGATAEANRNGLQQLQIARQAMRNVYKGLATQGDFSMENKQRFCKHCSIALACIQTLLEDWKNRTMSRATERFDSTYWLSMERLRNVTKADEDVKEADGYGRTPEVTQTKHQSPSTISILQDSTVEGLQAFSLGLTEILENLSENEGEGSSEKTIELQDVTDEDKEASSLVFVDTLERLQDIDDVQMKMEQLLIQQSKP